MSAFSSTAHFLAASSFLANNWGCIASALIVVIGLFVFGLSDVTRFSFTRIWAISGVCFDESIRKKVLWITPLAIVGVIVVTQLQEALDEQDAIRQTIKFCLFATGMVVILSSIILACTNLPKEIENRVIFTIVTKPTTRLEVILGKILGFSRVSAAILLIMGIFTWGYLYIREQSKLGEIGSRLQEGNVTQTEKARLSHYEQTGLLSARELWAPDELQIYGAPPDTSGLAGKIANESEEDFLVPFELDHNILFPDGQQSGAGAMGLVIRVDLNWATQGHMQDTPNADEMPTTAPAKLGPAFPATRPAAVQRPAAIDIDVFDSGRFSIITGVNMVGASSREKLAQAISDWLQHPKPTPSLNAARVRLHPPGQAGYAYAWVSPTEATSFLYNRSEIFIRVAGSNVGALYSVGKEPVRIYLPKVVNERIYLDEPPAYEFKAVADESGQPHIPLFRGQIGIQGDQEITGGTDSPRATAVYTFHNAPAATLVNGQIPFELSNLQLQRDNESDPDASREDPTALALTVHDVKSNKDTNLRVLVETRQASFFSIPADAITSPDFQILMQCDNKGHTVGFYPTSLELVTGRENFGVNLCKSLFIIWMMSVLVIALSILCSTFLSWPIAIVLTVILLLGHWGVDQLADTNAPGLGRMFVNDFKISDAAAANVVSSSVDTLSSALNNFAKVLPDTGQFDSVSEIEQGVTVSTSKLLDAFLVMVGFGLPAAVLAYVILKHKEVAP